MKKKYVIKKHDDFSNVIENGRFFKDKSFIIYVQKNNLDHYRFGISVGKKNGNAVTRNKIKRQMRMIIDNYKKNYQNGMDYIIIIKYSYILDSFSNIKKSFENIIDKINRKISEEEQCNEKK